MVFIGGMEVVVFKKGAVVVLLGLIPVVELFSQGAVVVFVKRLVAVAFTQRPVVVLAVRVAVLFKWMLVVLAKTEVVVIEAFCHRPVVVLFASDVGRVVDDELESIPDVSLAIRVTGNPDELVQGDVLEDPDVVAGPVVSSVFE